MPAALAILTFYMAVGLVAGTIGGAVAPRKRRHSGFWTTATFLVPPLLLVLLLLPRSRYAPLPPERDWEPDNLDRL